MYISLLQLLLHKTQQHGTSPEEEKKAIKSKRNGQTARETEERERESEKKAKRVAFGEEKKTQKQPRTNHNNMAQPPREKESNQEQKKRRKRERGKEKTNQVACWEEKEKPKKTFNGQQAGRKRKTQKKV
jgi:hypothetical protein